MSDPKLLMLDQRLLGLAPIAKNQIFGAIRKLKGELSIILVEQDIAGALQVSDRAMFLREGRVSLESRAPRSELLSYLETVRIQMGV